MNYAGLQWKKSLQCRSAKALSPIGTPSGGIRNKCHRRRKMTASSLQTWRRQRYIKCHRPASPDSSPKSPWPNAESLTGYIEHAPFTYPCTYP